MIDPFDATHGTETAIINRLWLDRLFRRKECSRYQAVDETLFSEAMTDVPRWRFIDMGCGKGKALIMAHEAGFRDGLIGVEFSKDMCQIASANLRTSDTPASILHMDAREFRFPDVPCVVFLYNPFGEEIMHEVVSNFGTAPRIVVYVNPLHPEPFDGLETISKNDRFRVYRNC